MTEEAQKLLEALPEDGSKVKGSELLNLTGLSKLNFRKAKAELKAYGMIELGRGRGGSVTRIIGVEPPEEEKKLSHAEKLEFAREAKKSRAKEQKERNKIRENAHNAAASTFPDADAIVVAPITDHYVFVEVWKDGKAEMYRGHRFEYE